MTSKVYCLYFVVNEDGESEEMPNCVELSVAPGFAVTLHTLKQALKRLPGILHFRCRVDDPSGHLWLDITDSNEPLPLSEGCVFAKVQTLPFACARLISPSSCVSLCVISGHQVLRLDKPTRPASRLKVKAGAKIIDPGSTANNSNPQPDPRRPSRYSDDSSSNKNGANSSSSRQPVVGGSCGGGDRVYLKEAVSATTAAAPRRAAIFEPPPLFAARARVELRGIKAKPELNGTCGTVKSFDACTGR
jgi:hypothetical protein